MTIAFVAPLCLCILAASPARLSRLEQGQKAFGDGEYVAALRALDLAAAEGADLERVQLLRAQCFAAQQDFSRAEEAFALALEANPEASLDPTRVDPSVVKVLDGLRARTQGAVVVRSTPPGAIVTLDGKAAGTAPATLKTTIGRHQLEAKWPTGGVAATAVLVRARRDTYLMWVQGEVPVASAPVEPPEKPATGVHPFADVRGLLETGGGVYGAMEIGAGIELRYFRGGLHLRLVPDFGMTVRAALVVPVVSMLSAFVEAELPMIFNTSGGSSSVAVGVGASGGAEWHAFRFLGFWVAVGGRHFFLHSAAPAFVNNDRFEGLAGVRLRLP